MPPARRTSVATIPSVITARTTPYSAIVWPSSFRQLARAYSSHAANVISVHLLSSSRRDNGRRNRPKPAGGTRCPCDVFELLHLGGAIRPRSDSSRTLAWPHAAICAFDVAIIERSRCAPIPRKNDSSAGLPKRVTALLREPDDCLFHKRRVCGPVAS